MLTCPVCGLKILEHPANRCLDALVAEKVMGWRRDTYYIQVGTTKSETREGLFGPAGIRFVDQYPEYTTDIAAAWDVVDKLNLLTNHVLIGCDEDKLWQIFDLKYGELVQASILDAETAPLAICRAGLLVTLEIP